MHRFLVPCHCLYEAEPVRMKTTNNQRIDQVKIIKPHNKRSCLRGHKLRWEGGERVVYKDFKGAETHPSGLEDEVLLPHERLCMYVCRAVILQRIATQMTSL